MGRNLGDVPTHVTRSAADAVLEYLKNDSLKDFDRKKEIDDILGSSMGPKEFNELVNLGKKITDYDTQDEDEEMEDGEGGEGPEVDENQGVAVVFDEDEEDEDAAQTFEVHDEDTSDEEGEAEPAAKEADASLEDEDGDNEGGIVDTEEIVIQGSTTAAEKLKRNFGPAYTRT